MLHSRAIFATARNKICTGRSWWKKQKIKATQWNWVEFIWIAVDREKLRHLFSSLFIVITLATLLDHSVWLRSSFFYYIWTKHYVQHRHCHHHQNEFIAFWPILTTFIRVQKWNWKQGNSPGRSNIVWTRHRRTKLASTQSKCICVWTFSAHNVARAESARKTTVILHSG